MLLLVCVAALRLFQLTIAGNDQVVIHSGGAHRGHYHAYIRDLTGQGVWISPGEVKDKGQKQARKPGASSEAEE